MGSLVEKCMRSGVGVDEKRKEKKRRGGKRGKREGAELGEPEGVALGTWKRVAMGLQT